MLNEKYGRAAAELPFEKAQKAALISLYIGLKTPG
jgi:hypothetical protein